MNKILATALLATLSSVPLLADTSSTFQTASPSYVGFHEPLQPVRVINGGTIIKTEYTEDVPYEMQSAFDHACRLWEEAMPNSLPISISVSIGSLPSSSKTVLSKVSMRQYTNLGMASGTTPSSVLKHVILGEYESLVNYTFFDYINNVNDIDTITPDISIIYNKNLLDQMSFSIDDEITDKYDFVTVALRDIAKGLGLQCSFTASSNATSFSKIPKDPLPFERAIISKIDGTDANAFKKATSGSVELREGFSLYAPSPWEAGVSLQTTIPSDKIGLSRLMDYRFGKGFTMRNFCDEDLKWIFTYELQYNCNAPVGPSAGTSSNGSTSSFIPFNKKAQFPSTTIKTIGTPSISVENTSLDNKVEDYLKNFAASGKVIQILKKDGTWDTVKILPYENPGPSNSISGLRYEDLEFHYSANEYARTADGYLRGRKVITTPTSTSGNYSYRNVSNWYFVVDCLPQEVKLKAHNDKSSTQNSGDVSTHDISIGGGIGTDIPIMSNSEVSIGMKNLEGVSRVVLEVLPVNSKVPVRIIVPDLKSGVYNLDLGEASSATVTPISYNENGSTRGETITVRKFHPIVNPPIIIQHNQNELKISGQADDSTAFPYEILDMTDGRVVQTGATCINSSVSTEALSKGMYVIKCHPASESPCEYKFTVK